MQQVSIYPPISGSGSGRIIKIAIRCIPTFSWYKFIIIAVVTVGNWQYSIHSNTLEAAPAREKDIEVDLLTEAICHNTDNRRTRTLHAHDSRTQSSDIQYIYYLLSSSDTGSPASGHAVYATKRLNKYVSYYCTGRSPSIVLHSLFAASGTEV